MTIETIRQPIAADLRRYADVFRDALQSDNPLLSAALTHLTRRLGKMMRPMLVLLCAREGGCVTPEAIHAAAGLEMLHTASLVHDDVVDESDMRRGQRSINALFDNKAAVLVGDFITSKALTEVALTHSLEAVERMAWLGQTLADGELLQLNNTHSTVFSENDYYEVISRKTAALFATCARLGAHLGGASDDVTARLEHFGHLVGLCFQLRDDIFDFDESLNVGKPKGNDLQEGKLTLPVIHALNATANARYHHLAMRVRALEASKLEVQELAEFTISHGGLEYAEAEMSRLRGEAITQLEGLRDAEVAQALRDYLDYVVQRNY
ncbi:MAG: polyprenyl synthetase family protein [Bacteroidaceae bacterium]|nr:polyprenyl synthetase family protein [Bacteroidaceae bacterium]